jgi:hypothetical protein
MAAGTFTLYDSVAEWIADGTIDLDTHTFKIILVTSAYTPSAAHDELADITNQLSTANGYTAGGGTLANVTWTRAAGVATFDSDNFVWTASGGSITARRAVMYDDTVAGDPLIGHFLLDATPADLTATDGNTFTVGPHASNGWFQLTVNPA